MNHPGTAGCVRVLLFSEARDAAGVEETEIPCPPDCTQEEFLARLTARFPALARVAPASRLARNQTYCSPGERFHPGDEIALIPPVSGG